MERGPIQALAGGPEGAPLLLGIHGWSQRNGRHTWAPLFFEMLTYRCQCVALDMPGWGQSPAWGTGVMSAAEAAAALTGVMDQMGAAQAVLCGKSWGGAIAVHLAQSEPERVSALVLSAPAIRQPFRASFLKQPIFLTWSEDDEVIPLARAQALMEGYPHLRYLAFPAGGHNAANSNAAALAPELASFLSLPRR